MLSRARGVVPLAALGVLALAVLLPLTAPGFVVADDADLHRWRLWEFWQEWRRGQMPVRWGSDLALSFGSPLYTFYGPLGYLLGAAAMGWGFGAADALKLVFAVALAAGGLGAFVLAREWHADRPFANWTGLVGGAAYLHAPYVLANVYRRAALGECVALAVAPWFLLALLRLHRQASIGRVLPLALATAGLIAAHALTAATFAAIGMGLVATWTLSERVTWSRRLHRVGAVFFALAMGLALTAFYWLPALAQIGAAHSERLRGGDVPAFLSSFVPIPEMLQYTLFHDYRLDLAPKPPTWPHLGLVQMALLAIGAVAAVRRDGWTRWQTTTPLVASCLALYLASPGSQGLWRAIGPLQAVQYPWRFFGVLALMGALLVPGLLLCFPRPARAALVIAGLVTLSAANVGLLSAPWRDSWDTRSNLADYETGTYLPGLATYHEFYPRWVKRYGPGLLQPIEAAATATGLDVAATWIGPGLARLEVRGAAPATLTLDSFYFPGWSASIDGAPAVVRAAGELGLVTVDLAAGTHQVEIRRDATTVERVGDTISLAGLTSWIVLAAAALTTATPSARVLSASAVLVLAILAAPLVWAAARPLPAETFLPVPPFDDDRPVRLLGASIGGPTAAGETEVTVAFFVRRLPEHAPTLKVRLLDATGAVVAEAQRELGGPARPRAIWVPGSLMSDRLTLAPSVPGQWIELSLDGETPTRLGPIAVAAGTPVLGERHPPAQTAADQPVEWGGDLVLEHARLWPSAALKRSETGPDAAAVAFDRYRGEFYWRRLSEGRLASRAVVRLVDAQGEAWAVTEAPIRLPSGSDRDWRPFDLGPWSTLPPGHYRVLLAVGNGGNAALSVSSPAQLAGRTDLELSAFDVDPPCACVPPGGSVVGIDLVDGLRLLGYRRESVGASIDVTLYWQARDRITHRYTSFVHLLGLDRSLHAQFDRSPYDDRRPTDRWQLGEVVPFFARLRTLTDDPLRVIAGLYDDPAAPSLRRADGREPISLGIVEENVPPAGRSAVFENGIELRGVRISRQDTRLRVTAYWRRGAPVAVAYTVFVHLLTADGRIVAQGDGPPELGDRSTVEWARGETVVDPHDVDLSGTIGPLRLRIGLYRPGDNVRLRTRDGADSVELGEVPAS